MKLERVACCLCHSAEADPWASESQYTMVKCRQCGLVYLNPRPAADEIDEAARTGMHKFGEQALNVVGRYSRNKVRIYAERLREIIPASDLEGPDISWLDVGAGYGEMVSAVQAVTPGRTRVLGIEPCEPKVARAKALGIPVTMTPLSQVRGPFTHVSLINVFSHLPDPVEFLRELGNLLGPQGKLILVTGNGGDVSRDEFPGSLYLPDHLLFGGEENVNTALALAGYDLIACKRYPDVPSFDGEIITKLKNLVRRVQGRAPVPTTLPPGSRFRSLWLCAKRRN
jgi:SAM-dependent methyltransferase